MEEIDKSKHSFGTICDNMNELTSIVGEMIIGVRNKEIDEEKFNIINIKIKSLCNMVEGFLNAYSSSMAKDYDVDELLEISKQRDKLEIFKEISKLDYNTVGTVGARLLLKASYENITKEFDELIVKLDKIAKIMSDHYTNKKVLALYDYSKKLICSFTKKYRTIYSYDDIFREDVNIEGKDIRESFKDVKDCIANLLQYDIHTKIGRQRYEQYIDELNDLLKDGIDAPLLSNESLPLSHNVEDMLSVLNAYLSEFDKSNKLINDYQKYNSMNIDIKDLEKKYKKSIRKGIVCENLNDLLTDSIGKLAFVALISMILEIKYKFASTPLNIVASSSIGVIITAIVLIVNEVFPKMFSDKDKEVIDAYEDYKYYISHIESENIFNKFMLKRKIENIKNK